MKQSEIFCTSLDVAHEFGKLHKNVLRDIRKLKCSADFHCWNFEITQQTVNMPHGGTRNEIVYLITQEGYTFLTMGYTGKRVAPVKEEIINSGKIN